MDLALDLLSQAMDFHAIGQTVLRDEAVNHANQLVKSLRSGLPPAEGIILIDRLYRIRQSTFHSHLAGRTAPEKTQVQAPPPAIPEPIPSPPSYDSQTHEIIIRSGDTPGRIAQVLTGKASNWKILFPNLADPRRLQVGRHPASMEARLLIEMEEAAAKIKMSPRETYKPEPYDKAFVATVTFGALTFIREYLKEYDPQFIHRVQDKTREAIGTAIHKSKHEIPKIDHLGGLISAIGLVISIRN